MQIYISAWSLKENIRNGSLSLEELPEFAKSHGFDGVELMDRQMPGFDSDYLEGLKSLCQEHSCAVILDVSSDLTYSQAGEWLDQINYVLKMLKVAKQIGAGKVRLLVGGQSFSLQKIFNLFGRGKFNKLKKETGKLQPTRYFLNKLLVNKTTVQFAHSFRKNRKIKIKNETLRMQRAVQALRKILPEAQQLEIPLVIENHWGISSRPENILQIVNQFSSPFLGTCPDFDNFPKEVDPYEGLRVLAAKALHVHAKGIRFDANGEEQDIDYRRCLHILKECGYDDTITVEYEGTGDAVKGCLQLRDLILKYW